MHIAKFNISQCGHVLKHFERSVDSGHYSNTNIDEYRTKNNYNLCKEKRPKQINYIKQKLEEIPHIKRKDLVCMCSLILDVPKTLPENLYDNFFEAAYKFLVNRYGSKSGFSNPEDIVISCYCHKDEITPHIHFAFLPIKENSDGSQKFCSKEIINRNDLRTLHKDMQDFLQEECGIRADIVNGKTQRNSFGKALSVPEMKRRDYDLNRDYSRERRF